MAFSRLRGLARRVKNRVNSGPRVGEQFSAGQDTAFARLDDNADSSFQLIGASVVSTWEVLLTDLARAMQGGIPPAEARKILDRISDALVPTQEPLQSAGKIYRKALKHGVQSALHSGQLADATTPIATSIQPLPEKLGVGWLKTVDYLQPVLERLAPDGSLQADFTDGQANLVLALQQHGAAYASAMAAMPDATDLDDALGAALDAWRLAVARDLEIFLYARRTAMVNAATQLPR